MNMPVIDESFDLERALAAMGFDIHESDDGSKSAFGFVDIFDRDITVEFNKSFISDTRFDMKISADHDGVTDILYIGIAPVCARDFDTIMSYLIPGREFVNHLGIFDIEKNLM